MPRLFKVKEAAMKLAINLAKALPGADVEKRLDVTADKFAAYLTEEEIRSFAMQSDGECPVTPAAIAAAQAQRCYPGFR